MGRGEIMGNDWKSRGNPVDEAKSDWKSRSNPIIEEPSFAHQAGVWTANALPLVGTVAGGVLGAPLAPPYGSIGGATLGAGLGASAKGAILGSMGEPIGDPVTDIGVAMAEGAIAEIGGQAVGKALGLALEKGGEALYKSGLPGMAKMAVDDIKDTLFKMKVTGNKQQVADALQGIIDQHMKAVDDLAAKATEEGGIVSMRKAMQPALKMAEQIEKDKDPALQDLAAQIRNKAKLYLRLDATPATRSIETGSLPIQGETIPSYSEIIPKKINFELPIQGETIPEYSTFGIQRNEVSLPIQGQYAPSYSTVGSQTTKSGSLPVQGQPMPIRGALGEQIGTAIVSRSEIPFNYLEAIPGKTYPKQFVQSEPVVGKYSEIIPGQNISERFMQKEPVQGSYTQMTQGPTHPEQLLQKPEIPIQWVEETPATPGVGPNRAVGYKRTLAHGVPGKLWEINRGNPAWVNAQKVLTGGMKGAVEESIGQTLGPEAQASFIQNNQQAGRLIDYKNFISPVANQAERAITPSEAMVIGAKPAIGIPLSLVRKLVEKEPLKYGLKAYEMGKNLQASPWRVSAPVSGSIMGGEQLIENLLMPQNQNGSAEMPSQGYPSKLEIGKQMAEQAVRSGVDPSVVDNHIKKTPELSNTEKAQIRKQLTEQQ